MNPPDATLPSTQLPALAGPVPTMAAPRRASNAGSMVRMLVWGLLALLALGGGAYAMGAFELDGAGTGPLDRSGGGGTNRSWSYYHDREYSTRDTGAKWSTDRSRSSDPAEAALGDTTRWEYDGPYRYGSYGSQAMRERSRGRDTADPLYSQPAPIQDVFSAYGGDLDPSGGEPVGTAPSSATSPYYDPYAGYSNPYANRIRLGYGEGVGRGADTNFDAP